MADYKFKVGDRVRVVERENHADPQTEWTYRNIGKQYVIEKCIKNRWGNFYVNNDSGADCYECNLELIEPQYRFDTKDIKIEAIPFGQYNVIKEIEKYTYGNFTYQDREPITKTKQEIMNIKKFVKDLTLSEPKKSYIKYGLMTEQGEYTEEVRELAVAELVDAHIATKDFQEKLGQFVEEQKAEK